MAHHNYELSDQMRQVLGFDNPTGATGRYPEGKYHEHDEGEIRFAVAADVKAGKVLIDFGKPVHSLGMTAEQAQGLVDVLQQKVWELRGIR